MHPILRRSCRKRRRPSTESISFVSRSSTISAHLDTWADTENQSDWSGILLGNGFSRELWEPFDYPFASFREPLAEISHPLTATDKALFSKLGNTTNFESVLADLLTATTVNQALEIPHSEIPRRYRSIRRALIEAVHSIHLPWDRLPKDTKTRVRKALRRYSSVFTTNYYLLVYWCIMARGGDGFKDYFWNPTLTPAIRRSGATTKILYLHGALHLYRTAVGRTIKEVGDVSGGLSTASQPMRIVFHFSRSKALPS